MRRAGRRLVRMYANAQNVEKRGTFGICYTLLGSSVPRVSAHGPLISVRLRTYRDLLFN